ncbi:MAG: hypothetical protein DBX55_07985 [Verrucomicrobia bacterium]|nr:MAG: hypothetical protein DBX55_07985 [Verrucomicrobiota bacterium]
MVRVHALARACYAESGWEFRRQPPQKNGRRIKKRQFARIDMRVAMNVSGVLCFFFAEKLIGIFRVFPKKFFRVRRDFLYFQTDKISCGPHACPRPRPNLLRQKVKFCKSPLCRRAIILTARGRRRKIGSKKSGPPSFAPSAFCFGFRPFFFARVFLRRG